MAATVWNSADKSANITLSGSNLVATTSSATQGAVRTNNSVASGKVYFEALISTLTGTLWSVGFANASAALGTAMGGTDKNSVVFQPNQTGRGFFNNASLGSSIAGVAGRTVCIAFDIGAKLIWFRYANGLWNNSATADPATGAGGYSVSAINAGPYYLVFACNGSGGAITANFGATPFQSPVPSGFSGLDASSLTYVAVSKFNGLAIMGPPQNAVSVAKLTGYALLGPLQTGLSVAKLLGYAILSTDTLLAANAKAQATLTADLTVINPVNLAASLTAQATLTADLSVSTGADLAANLTAQATLSADLSVNLYVGSVLSAICTLSASLSVTQPVLSVSKLNGLAILGPPQDAVTVSKLAGLAILGPPQNAASVSKVAGLAILGPPDAGVSVSKLVGYAILGPPPPHLGVSKLLGYAILKAVPAKTWVFDPV